jgi:hypothetical protein
VSEHRYCGRLFTDAELVRIAHLCQELPTRIAVARRLSEELDWRGPGGQPKEMSARVALLRMERDGLLRLPPPTKGNGNHRWPWRLPPEPVPPPTLQLSLRELGQVRLRPLFKSSWRDPQTRLWNELIARHHYLGYSPLPGAQLRYFIEAPGLLLGLFGMGAAAWTCQPRDRFIGWDSPTRRRNLHLVVGNARFLILPGVKVPHLASHALGLLARRLGLDWEAAYGYRPVLLETFVETDRFSGASYRAANWAHVGRTQGRGKLDRQHQRPLPLKDVYLFPLNRRFRSLLA